MHVGLTIRGILNVQAKYLGLPVALIPAPVPRLYLPCSSSTSKPSTTTLQHPPLTLFRSKVHAIKLTGLNVPNLHNQSRSLATQAMEFNGSIRNKRKQSPVTAIDRPAKHLKPVISPQSDGDETPAGRPLYGIESDGDDGPLLPLAPATADTVEWQATIETVVRRVVSIHFCQTCSFDTDPGTSSEATGFVVDAEKGAVDLSRDDLLTDPTI